MVKHLQAESLPLRMVSEVCFKAKALYDGEVCLDEEDGGSSLRLVGCDGASAFVEYGVDGFNAVGWGDDFNQVDGLHEAGGGHEEAAVAYTAGGGDDLAGWNGGLVTCTILNFNFKF